jgi:hypothetical protein
MRMKSMMKCAMMLILPLFLAGNTFCGQDISKQLKEPVDYVSPNIGGIGQLLTATIPYVQYPHGMARLAPITTPGIADRYLSDKIYGFPAGPAMLMASTGAADTHPENYASDFDHDFETATPYYYAADLETWGVRAEFTASEEAAYYRFTFPVSAHSHLVLSLDSNVELSVVGNNAVQGSERIDGPIARPRTLTARRGNIFTRNFPVHSALGRLGNTAFCRRPQSRPEIASVSFQIRSQPRESVSRFVLDCPTSVLSRPSVT